MIEHGEANSDTRLAQPLTFTIAALARAANISMASFWALVGQGRGPRMFRPGRRKWLITADDAAAWITRLRDEGQPAEQDRAAARERARQAAIASVVSRAEKLAIKRRRQARGARSARRV